MVQAMFITKNGNGIKINFNGLITNLKIELQRIVDLTIVGHNVIDNYMGPYHPELVFGFQFHPLGMRSIPDENFPKEFKTHLIKSGLRDSLEHFVAYMSNLESACVAFKKIDDYKKHGDKSEIDITECFWKYERKPFPAKIEQLEDEYDIDDNGNIKPITDVFSAMRRYTRLHNKGQL